MMVDIDHIQVSFDHQGHRIKVKVIERKVVILLLRRRFHSLFLILAIQVTVKGQIVNV